MEVDLQSKVEKYEAKAVRCEEQAGQAADKALDLSEGHLHLAAFNAREVIPHRPVPPAAPCRPTRSSPLPGQAHAAWRDLTAEVAGEGLKLLPATAAKCEEFPVAVRRVGATYHVPVAEFLRFPHASESIDQPVPDPRESSRQNRH